VQRIGVHQCCCGSMVFGQDNVGTAGAVGEAAAFLESTRGEQLLQEGAVRFDHRGVELRGALGQVVQVAPQVRAAAAATAATKAARGEAES